MDRHGEAIKRAFATTATITAMYVNAHLEKGAEKVSPAAFIPGCEDEAPATGTAPELQPMLFRKWAEEQNKRYGEGTNNPDPGA